MQLFKLFVEVCVVLIAVNLWSYASYEALQTYVNAQATIAAIIDNVMLLIVISSKNCFNM